MTSSRIALLYLLTVPVFFLIDMVWLGLVARGFYKRQLGGLLAEQVNWTAAIVFYLLFIGGILLFAVLPAVERGSLVRAATLGALLGLLTYATYDLTNLATLRGFPLKVALVDMVWGMVLTGSVATVSFLIARRLG